MASSSMVSKFACALIVCMVMAASLAEAAINCGTVTTSLAPCLPFLTGEGVLTSSCCQGVSNLNHMASTTPDRQTACNCLKSTSAAISNINYNNAAQLPSECGLNIPYKISPSTDCSKVV